MAKKTLSKRERDKRIKKRIKIFSIGFVAAVVLAIILGIAIVKISDYREEQRYLNRITDHDIASVLLPAYREDPWEGENALNQKEIVLSERPNLYFLALRALEMNAAYDGGDGYEFDASAGKVMCLETSQMSDQALRNTVCKMYEDYAASKGFSFKASTMEKLSEEGLIDENAMKSYKEGVIIKPGILGETEKDIYLQEIQIYYNYMSIRIPEVYMIKEEAYEQFVKNHLDEYTLTTENDSWSVYVRNYANGYSDEKVIFRYDGWYAYVEPGMIS